MGFLDGLGPMHMKASGTKRKPAAAGLGDPGTSSRGPSKDAALLMEGFREALGNAGKSDRENEKTILLVKDHKAGVKLRDGMSKFDPAKLKEKGKANPLGDPRWMVMACVVEPALEMYQDDAAPMAVAEEIFTK